MFELRFNFPNQAAIFADGPVTRKGSHISRIDYRLSSPVFRFQIQSFHLFLGLYVIAEIGKHPIMIAMIQESVNQR